MSVALITGSCGLIGSEATEVFASAGMSVVGIDNDLRSYFFGPESSTQWKRQILESRFPTAYAHEDLDIRDGERVERVFGRYGRSISVVIHAAAQPSHDWAAREPATDFAVNATGTMNLLEATRRHCPEAPFIFCSTNKVYGDRPNRLPLVEHETRWEIESGHRYENGIDETMSIDQCLHSLFGASKLAADIAVQEYGRYFQMPTACFRGGCLTGPNHSGAQLHGFLAYLLKCTAVGEPYTVFGYAGKQVRDNIHSSDLVRAFEEFFKAPRVGEVYNIGGGRFSNCSMREAIEFSERIVGRSLEWSYTDENRIGDHMWWISDNSRFESHYPGWKLTYDVERILQEMYETSRDRWLRERVGSRQ